MRTPYLDMNLVQFATRGLHGYPEVLELENTLSSSFTALDSWASSIRTEIDGLKVQIANSSGSGILSWVSVAQFTGTDTQKFVAAFDRAAKIGSTAAAPIVYIPRGTYRLTRTGAPQVGYEYCVRVTGTNGLKVLGEPGTVIITETSNLVANYAHIFLLTSCSNTTFSDIEFSGTQWDNDLGTNGHCAIATSDTIRDLLVTNCTFRNCPPVAMFSDIYSERVTFMRNVVVNSPNPLSLCDYSTIVFNTFTNDTRLEVDPAGTGSRTHAIYMYGNAGHMNMSFNKFKNITKSGLKYKGSSAKWERKSHAQVIGNQLENCEYALEIGSDSEVCHSDIIVSKNTIQNCSIGINGFVLSNTSIEDNTIFHDMDTTWLSASGIVVQDSGAGSIGASATAGDVVIKNNRLTMRANGWVTKMLFSSNPVHGDSVSIDGVRYAFTTGSKLTPLDVVIQGTANATAVEFVDVVRSDTFGAMNPILQYPDDIVAPTNAPPGQDIVKIVGKRNYGVALTSSAITITEGPVRYMGRFLKGFQVIACQKPVIIEDNYTKDVGTPFDLNNIVNLSSKRNKIYGWTDDGSAPWAYRSLMCANARHENNEFFMTPTTVDTANRRIEIDDPFPIFRGNSGIVSIAGTALRSHLLGGSGYTGPGNGRAWTAMHYGDLAIAGTAQYTASQAIPFNWRDGDTVEVGNQTASLTFFFKRSGYSANLNQFGTMATLMALVNTSASWVTASNIVGSYVELRARQTGSAGNSYYVRVNTSASTCGVLPNSAEKSGTIASSSFGGGSDNSPTKTLLLTPLAALETPLFFTPANAAAASIGSSVYVDRAQTKPRHSYTIEHSSASGGELFWYGVL